MTVTLELTQEELTVLNAYAGATGIDIESALHRLIAALAAVPQPATPLAEHSAPETDDAEAQEEREREAQEMQNNIRRWRAEQGRGV